MSTPEGAVKKRVSAALKAIRAWYVMPVPNGFGQPNIDYNACVPCKACGRGLFVAVETKKPGAKPTPQQEATISRLRAAGAAVFVIDGDTAALEAWLKENTNA